MKPSGFVLLNPFPMKKRFIPLRRYLNDLFELNRSERNGVTILLGLIIFLILYNYSIPYLFQPPLRDVSNDAQQFKTWLMQMENASKNSSSPDYTDLLIDRNQINAPNLSLFDPNTATENQLLELGFTHKQIQTIQKYKDKGGVFRIKKDFTKMYFMTPALVAQYWPYLNLPEEYTNHKKQKESPPFSYPTHHHSTTEFYKQPGSQNLRIDINSADTSELKKIKGIGSFTAQNIIRYRNRLGGFVSIDQLLEVYPLNEQRLDSIRSYLLVDSGLVAKININECNWNQLSKHPYLNASQAKSIIAYRSMHGQFTTIADIQKSVLVDQKTYEKIKDYLIIH